MGWGFEYGLTDDGKLKMLPAEIGALRAIVQSPDWLIMEHAREICLGFFSEQLRFANVDEVPTIRAEMDGVDFVFEKIRETVALPPQGEQA